MQGDTSGAQISRRKLPRSQLSAAEGRVLSDLWRHGLTFNILHLTVYKKSVVKLDSLYFLVFLQYY